MVYFNRNICKRYGLDYLPGRKNVDKSVPLTILHTNVLLSENPSTFDSYQTSMLKEMDGYIAVKRTQEDDPGWFRISKIRGRIEGVVAKTRSGRCRIKKMKILK